MDIIGRPPTARHLHEMVQAAVRTAADVLSALAPEVGYGCYFPENWTDHWENICKMSWGLDDAARIREHIHKVRAAAHELGQVAQCFEQVASAIEANPT